MNEYITNCILLRQDINNILERILKISELQDKHPELMLLFELIEKTAQGAMREGGEKISLTLAKEFGVAFGTITIPENSYLEFLTYIEKRDKSKLENIFDEIFKYLCKTQSPDIISTNREFLWKYFCSIMYLSLCYAPIAHELCHLSDRYTIKKKNIVLSIKEEEAMCDYKAGEALLNLSESLLQTYDSSEGRINFVDLKDFFIITTIVGGIYFSHMILSTPHYQAGNRYPCNEERTFIALCGAVFALIEFKKMDITSVKTLAISAYQIFTGQDPQKIEQLEENFNKTVEAILPIIGKLPTHNSTS